MPETPRQRTGPEPSPDLETFKACYSKLECRIPPPGMLESARSTACSLPVALQRLRSLIHLIADLRMMKTRSISDPLLQLCSSSCVNLFAYHALSPVGTHPFPAVLYFDDRELRSWAPTVAIL